MENRVYESETLIELAEAIRSLAVDGMIQGLTRKFPVEPMISACLTFDPNRAYYLTRNYGIRAQAFMIYYYDQQR